MARSVTKTCTIPDRVVIKDAKLFLKLVYLSYKDMYTGDFDPVYPMLEVLTRGLSKEDSLWYAFCYVGHYNLASGARAFRDYPTQVPSFPRKYPIRFQRRNLHPTGQYDRHFQSMWSLKQKYGSLAAWLEDGMTGDGKHDFNYVRERVLDVHANGRWAGMKLGEVLKYTTYPHLIPCDMGHRYSAAPRKGLGYFYTDPGDNSPRTIAYLDQCGRHLTNNVISRLPPENISAHIMGYTFHWPWKKKDTKHDWPLDVAEMETNLCDFKSMYAGEFYSGKCADVVLLTMTDCEMVIKKEGLPASYASSVLTPLYNARAALYDHKILGEFSGWSGVDPKRDMWFKQYGVIPWRHETTAEVTDLLRAGEYPGMILSGDYLKSATVKST